ncbi:Lrp/AsnC family transcriptional regulator [Ancylobacter sp.]|uniref:Lrp/AsnC family transcriptional regulator n=1 Tax=Ancylobacter sp. TaxID=1872567 RepID=UPI003BAC7A44
MQMDSIDLRILSELQQNAKLTNAELASRVNLSASPCLTRVRAPEVAGIIDRYVTLLDPEEIGLTVNVFIQISLDRQIEMALERFEKAVLQFPEVMECYLMTGNSDYLLRVAVKDLGDLERLIVNRLSRIENMSSIRSSIALKRVKYHTELPLPQPSRPIGGR